MCPRHQEEEKNLVETENGNNNNDPLPAFNLPIVKWPAAIAVLCLLSLLLLSVVKYFVSTVDRIYL